MEIEEDTESETPIPEVEPPEPVIVEKKSSTLDEINEERRIAKKMTMIGFLSEYSKAPNRQTEDVAAKLGLNTNTARKYVKEYIQTVKDSIREKTYPDGVLLFYNEDITDEDRTLKFHHMDKLKDVVKKYSAFDIDINLGKTVNSNDTFNSKVDSSSPPISLLSSTPPPVQPTEPASNYNDIQMLHNGITSMQLIRFGLTNTFGQHATMKISNMLGIDPTPYLMDEQNLKSLLLMSGSTEPRAQYFINWLKTNAHYVANPVGFLSYGSNYSVTGVPPGGANYYSQGGGQQTTNLYGNAEQLDEMDKFYYDIRVYQKGLPPNHPINRQNLDKYKEEKREEEQLKMIDRRTNIAMRTQMLKSFSMMGGEGQQNNHSLFSPEMMVMTGNARWEVVGKREDGTNIYQVVPNVGGMQQQSQMGTPGQPMDQMTAMMTAMRSMMEMMQTIAKPNESQQSFFSSIMQGVSQKLFQQPASQIDDLSKAFEFFTKLKGPDPALVGSGVAPIDPTVAIETKRMETDKEFGMKILNIRERELLLKQQRLVEGDKEAANNINTLISGLQGILPELINVGKSLFMKGGGGGGAGGVTPEGFSGVGQGEAPIQTLIKMEYEKEKQRKQMEAARAEREWKEQMARSEQARQPETQRVVIQPPPAETRQTAPTEISDDDQAFFREETYIPYAPQQLEEALRKADKQIEVLERYKATVGGVLQDKIANGEKEPVEQPIQPTAAAATTTRKDEDQTTTEDYIKYLDEYPTDVHDPDYEGPDPNEPTAAAAETAATTTEKEEVDI
jgi:hypothetical protein